MSRVQSDDSSIANNLARQLMSLWETHFLRMSTCPLKLSTEHNREHSKMMSEIRPIEDEPVKHISKQEHCGFLTSR